MAFCDDPSSTDPVVIDFCEDIWTDDDDREEEKIPICDVDTPPGTPCIDEGDPDDCEPGFVDRGSGCEPEVQECILIFPPPPWCGGLEEEEGSEGIVDEDDTPELPELNDVLESEEEPQEGESGLEDSGGDGDGDLINEENELVGDCNFDHTFGAELGASMESTFGDQWETPPPTLSEDNCNFALHYLSGQCEEQTAKGANVTQV